MMKIKDCKCGVNISEETLLIDSLYPCNRERTEWQLVCQLHNCGCGRAVYASTKDKVIERWNNGETDEMEELSQEDEDNINRLIEEANRD